jgi:hypothetical protein
MPLTYSIDAARRVATLHYDGAVTPAEWTATMRALLADPAYAPRTNLLVDRRHAEVPSGDFVRDQVGFLAAHSGEMAGARVAILVDALVAVGMARMLQILAAEVPLGIEVFTDEREARRFVGADE